MRACVAGTQLCSAFSTIDYYAEVVDAAGGYEASQAFSRLYLVPGQSHCFTIGSGDPQVQVDLLTPLLDWVERGVAPADLEFPLAPDQETELAMIEVTPFGPMR